jgi:hypothetical protein
MRRKSRASKGISRQAIIRPCNKTQAGNATNGARGETLQSDWRSIRAGFAGRLGQVSGRYYFTLFGEIPTRHRPLGTSWDAVVARQYAPSIFLTWKRDAATILYVLPDHPPGLPLWYLRGIAVFARPARGH